LGSPLPVALPNRWPMKLPELGAHNPHGPELPRSGWGYPRGYPHPVVRKPSHGEIRPTRGGFFGASDLEPGQIGCFKPLQAGNRLG